MVKNGNGTTTANKYAWNTIFKHELESKIEIPDIIKPLYKNGESDWIGRQPIDTTPILYVSSIAGSKGWKEEDFTKFTGIKNRCFSYAYAASSSPLFHRKHEKYLNKDLKHGMRIFMDSGAHTMHRILRSGKTLAKRVKVPNELRKGFIEYLTDEWMRRYAEYIRWCYASGKKFDFWVTLDSQKDCKIIYEATKKLKKLIGIAPVSVYHGDSDLSWVRRYIDDGHKIICIGISSRLKGNEARHRYYSEVHELTQKYGMATHGLAVTGNNMLAYPWYSVDSATHIKVAAFGKILIIIPEKQRVAQVHISDQYSKFTTYGNIGSFSKGVKEHVRSIVDSYGFSYEDLVNSIDSRIYFNAAVLQKAVEANTKNKVKFKTWGTLA